MEREEAVVEKLADIYRREREVYVRGMGESFIDDGNEFVFTFF